MPPTAQNIADQRDRLAQHRQNVQTLLQQIAAQGGWIHAPLALLNTLSENWAQIARCKTVLLGWRQEIEHHPDDEAEGSVGALEEEIGQLEASRALPLPPVARQAVEQALQEAQERRKALLITVTVQASDQARVYQAGRDLVVHEASVDREGQRAERALTDYLRAVRHVCGPVQLNQIDQAESRFVQPMRLEQVYVRLNIERQVDMTKAEDEVQPTCLVVVQEALSASACPTPTASGATLSPTPTLRAL
jgi:hypothetical protein